MRILSGKYKNKPLKSPQSETTHPMGEREKLALFNMLLSELDEQGFENLTVLDAFAGSGALGLEALSRGAASVTFVDNNEKALSALKSNLSALSLASSSARVIKNPVSALVSKTPNKLAPASFDLIFADPPYSVYTPELVAPLAPLLKPSGLLVLSSPKSADVADFAPLSLLKSKTYAAARISLFRHI
ncbi:16S rRNA (guanine(966)-N(2))-methyltransferase RsmD [Candidatus Saccharibacteria bacterium]|nr:16S rRNA (guanine(966)-N(2))-methyltransferase RsmD [Candidatus Saccharibacteria bacterium]